MKYFIKQKDNVADNAGYDDSDYIKIKFISDNDLSLRHNVMILIRSVFEDDGRYFPQVFL